MVANTFSSEFRRPSHEGVRGGSVGVGGASDPFDLRRRKRRKRPEPIDPNSDLSQTLIKRSDHLPAADAALVLAAYRDAVPIASIAALGVGVVGVGGAGGVEPSTVLQIRRRLRKITRRCVDPLFAFVVLNARTFPPTMRRVATACVLHGMSVRQAAVALNLTHHAVRRHRESLLAIYHTSEQAMPASSSPRPTPTPRPTQELTLHGARR